MTGTLAEKLEAALERMQPGVDRILARLEELAGVPWQSGDLRSDGDLLVRSGRRLAELFTASRGSSREELEADPEAFLKGIRHDLRSQVSATMGCAELVLEDLDELGGAHAEARSALDAIVTETARLLPDIDGLQVPQLSGGEGEG